MKLRDVMLCIECDEVFELSLSNSCPSCGSKTIMRLSRWIQTLKDSDIKKEDISRKEIHG